MTQPTNTGAPGARPEDWGRLESFGLTEDLLPVVSDLTARISPMSKVKDIGKTPSRFNREDLVVGIPAWAQHRATERQVGNWSTDSRLGICVQTRRLRAIDIDIGDPVHAAEVRNLVELLAGPLPCRSRPNSGKMLLPFWCPGELTKRIIRTEHGIIELLANGQQFIAYGTHTSGVRYAWQGLEVVELAGWPELTIAELDGLWTALADTFGGGDSVALRTGVLPRVPRSKLDMHGDPVVAYLDENDWVTEFDRDGRVHVRCPWEREHTSDSGPSATSWFPAGVGGFAQGHFKCLHAHCAGRTDTQFLEAVGYEASMFEVVPVAPGKGGEPEPAEEDLPWPVFSRDKVGRIESTMDNATKALARPDICGARIAYDEFKDTVMVGWGEQWRPLRDVDYTDLRVALERRGFKGPGKDLVRDAALKVADANRFDSAIQWARGLQWDGIPRVESFFPRLFGVEDTPYARAVGLYLWTAMAGRCLVPGIKADMVPVLISGQGTRKTSMVEALAPTEDAFVEVNLEHRDADLSRSLRGKLVGELAELRGLATREAESIKAWITRRVEEWTPKYVEFATRYPRRFVLIGTGNRHEFLDDDTGERRWLPLTVGQVDLERIKTERDQLWAEAVALFSRGGVRWELAQALAVEQHAAFKVSDPWQEDIARWLEEDHMGLAGAKRRDTPFSMRDILLGALRFDAKAVGIKEQRRAGKVLRALGFESKDQRAGNSVVKVWLQAKNCT